MKRDGGMTMTALSRCAAEEAVFVTCCTGLKVLLPLWASVVLRTRVSF
jgi:hypothetical protein